VLVPTLASDETRAASSAVVGAIGAVGLARFDLVVVLSPHGSSAGVYRQVEGSLAAFGYPDIALTCPSDPVVAAELAEAWAQPLLNESVDYGVLVPMLLAHDHPASLGEARVVAACLPEVTTLEDPETVEKLADSFAQALSSMGGSEKALFIASANDSAGLSPRAPLTELPGAERLRDDLMGALVSDVALVDAPARRLTFESGSCGLGPLLALARLFAGRRAEVIVREDPVGVGYTVALTHG
jgi:hypothetical protein